MQELLKECVNYFTVNTAFKRLFLKVKDKYASLGHIGGSITIVNMSGKEKEAIGGLLRKDFHRQKSATISLESIQKAINQSRFNGLKLENILNLYFGEAIVSNKSIREGYLLERNLYFGEITTKYLSTNASKWLDFVLTSKSNAYNIFITQYDSNRDNLCKFIENVCIAINSLPVNRACKMRLPVFATEISKNPHTFDINNTCGKIFLQALSYLFDTDFPSSAEKRAELYYKAGILFDEVSSFVLCKGLQAYTAEGIHKGWEGFYNSNEVVMATLSNIGVLTMVSSPLKKVFAVENPAVFAAIFDKMEGKQTPIVCTNGQVKIATLALLDMLVQNGCEIYYSGDFDPEGLQIADKLATRYKEKLKLWRFSKEDYLLSISEKQMDESRMKKLESLKSITLIKLAQEIVRLKVAGYQEALLDKLVEDINGLGGI